MAVDPDNIPAQSNAYFRITSIEQISHANTMSICVDSKKISVKKASQIGVGFAYNNGYSCIHFGLICKNDWNVDEAHYRVALVHVMPKDNKAAVRVQFVQSIEDVKKILLKIASNKGNGTFIVSKFCANTTSLKQCIPLLNDVLQKPFIWKPWGKYSPEQFAKSKDINCKRFIQKVETHLNYKIPDQITEEAFKVIKKAIDNNKKIEEYVKKIPDFDKKNAEQVKNENACVIL